MTRYFHLVVSLTVALSAVATGCDLNRLTGEQGQLVFEYYFDEDHINFNKPIIEGGYHELFVYDVTNRERTQIEEARALTPKTAAVEGHVQHLVVVEALRPGIAEFQVRARDSAGQVRLDTLSMRVEPPHSLCFRPEDANAFSGTIVDYEEVGERILTVTTESRIEIPWTRRAANGEPLLGYGVYPIDVSPSDAARIHDGITDAETFTLMMPDEPTTFEVEPQQQLEGEGFVVEVVEPDIADEAVFASHQLFGELGLNAEHESHPVFEDKTRITPPLHHRNGLPMLANRLGDVEPADVKPLGNIPIWLLSWPIVALAALVALWIIRRIRARRC